jgi:hypothetical protein
VLAESASLSCFACLVGAEPPTPRPGGEPPDPALVARALSAAGSSVVLSR